MLRRLAAPGKWELARELSHGVALLALLGSSIGGLLAAAALAARAMGR
jgi:hypothetical protein